MKRCGRCGAVKPFSEFHRDRSRRDGLMNRCIDCELSRQRASYAPRPRVKLDRRCSRPDCDAKHFARGLCRLDYRRTYERDYRRSRRDQDLVYLKAMTSRGVRTVRCEVAPSGGLWVWCPHCSAMLGIRPGRPVHERWCPTVGSVVLNEEEVQWVIAEAGVSLLV